jgi:hypothetical protein
VVPFHPLADGCAARSAGVSRRPPTPDAMELQLTSCPECGRPAEIVERFSLPSTDGPVEHVRTRCITGPTFMTPADALGRRRYPG